MLLLVFLSAKMNKIKLDVSMEKTVVSIHVYIMEMEMYLKMLCYYKLCVKSVLFTGKTVY
jgi:hypothetical protein